MTTIDKEAFAAEMETFRKMARIVTVDNVIPHPNADKLELAIVGGWQVVVKLGEFKKGDTGLYCEIDSLVPLNRDEFFFLEERGENIKVIGEQNYCRIKTIRLRKELSQGLLVPVPADLRKYPAETNVTTILGVLKYEKVTKNTGNSIPRTNSWFSRLAAWIYGEEVTNLLPWPEFLSKSEQPRLQNITGQYNACVVTKEEFEESVKLNGSSMTVYTIETAKGFKKGVCSRNCEIDQEDIVFTWWQAVRRWVGGLLMRNRRMVMIHTVVWPSAYTDTKSWLKEFWTANKDVVKISFTLPEYVRRISSNNDTFLKFSRQQRLMDKLRIAYEMTGVAYTVQGELVGNGIQENFEGISGLEFYAYNLYTDGKTLVLPETAADICNDLDIKYVPLVSARTTVPETVKEALQRAEGTRALAKGGYREGIVFKSLTRDFSFKVVSNRFLEKEE